jgi:predicted MFS family arabinose efflux permease
VLLTIFFLAELRSTHPMLDLGLFRKPAFAGVSIAAFVLSAAMIAMTLYLALYLQNVLGYSPLEAGLRFLPFTLLTALAAPIGGKLTTQVPARFFFGLGLLGVGIGLLLMRGLTPSSEWTALLVGMVIAGAGMGLMNPPLASVALAVVDPARSGMASGINSTFRQVGIATGIAALGTIFQSRIETKAIELLAGAPGMSSGATERVASEIAAGGARSAIADAPAPARQTVGEAARSAFISGLNEILLIAAIVAFLGALLGFALVRARDFVRDPAAATAEM